MNFQDYIRYDAVGLAELIRKKEVSADEVLQAALNRLDEVNPKLNLLAHDLRERAAAWQGSSENADTPLAGVPFLLKDLLADWEGAPTWSGSRMMQHYIAKQNSDIVIGEQIIATLDGRTSQVCRSLDGRVFKVGEGRRPPFHINCRSTFILVLDPKYRGKGNTDKRASYEGVTDNKSYYEWLKTQPKSFQDDALGKKRAALFRDGGLSADDFARLNLNKNFEPLTLDEMRAKNPTAFEKAGI